MTTHPRYPHRPRDTRSLLITLAWVVIVFALILSATSCAPPVPRAIIPPKEEIRKLNVEPVVEAAGKTREAVRDVSRKLDDNRAAAGVVTDSTTNNVASQIRTTTAAAGGVVILGSSRQVFKVEPT